MRWSGISVRNLYQHLYFYVDLNLKKEKLVLAAPRRPGNTWSSATKILPVIVFLLYWKSDKLSCEKHVSSTKLFFSALETVWRFSSDTVHHIDHKWFNISPVSRFIKAKAAISEHGCVLIDHVTTKCCDFIHCMYEHDGLFCQSRLIRRGPVRLTLWSHDFPGMSPKRTPAL